MTDAHHLLAAGNLTMAAVCVNSARLNNAEGLTASEQEQLSAIQQVIEQASSSLRAGRDLFTREDGSSTRDLLPTPEPEWFTKVYGAPVVKDDEGQVVMVPRATDPILYASAPGGYTSSGGGWRPVDAGPFQKPIPYVYGCRQFDEGENLVWAPEGPCSGPCSSPDPCLRHSPNTGDEPWPT